jgi:hypothetical protein
MPFVALYLVKEAPRYLAQTNELAKAVYSGLTKTHHSTRVNAFPFSFLIGIRILHNFETVP